MSASSTIVSFSADTGDRRAQRDPQHRQVAGPQADRLVLDLRSNPGGLLDEAVSVCDLFLDKGEIVSQRGRTTQRESSATMREPGDDADGPADHRADRRRIGLGLRDRRRRAAGPAPRAGHGRAQLRQGQRADAAAAARTTTALRLTTARYYTPSGRSVQEGGIEPDIRVPQLSDPDYAKRAALPRKRPAPPPDQRGQAGRKELETDTATIRASPPTAEELKSQGIKDFQLHYALKTLGRLGGAGTGRRGARTATGGAQIMMRAREMALPSPALIALLLPAVLLGGASRRNIRRPVSVRDVLVAALAAFRRDLSRRWPLAAAPQSLASAVFTCSPRWPSPPAA